MTAAAKLKKRYGRWRVICRNGSASGGKSAWLCRCRCGVERVVVGTTLTAGLSRSCGCLDLERKRRCRGAKNPAYKHGMTNTPTFRVWYGMIHRCCNKSSSNYPRWGGRGIKVCPSWRRSFLNFLRDMGERPDGMTLGRRDNTGNYEPHNCRWETSQEQNRNRPSYNRIIEYQGQRKTVAEWSEIVGMSYTTIYQRLERGWPVERIFTQPQRKKKNN